jgi:sugar-phosphatase
MPELRVDAMIFDMDGVVIDSGDVYAKHWRLWGESHGIDFDRDIAHVHPGRPPEDTVRVVAPHLDAVAESIAFNDSLETDDGADAIEAMPGAAELLGSLPPDRWTIATSAFRDIAKSWLAHVGLPVPQALVTVDDVERGKPSPDPFLRAAELLGRDPARCVVVEDAPAGITAAKAAGATVLALRTTHGPEDLGEADYQTAGLWTVRSTIDSEGILVSWDDPD